MGYRSDVKIVFYLTHGCSETITEANDNTPNNFPIPFAALKLWFDENYPHYVATSEWCAQIEHGEDYILLTYHDVKWYPSYDHVQAIESVFEKFSETFRSNERDHRAQYELVRIGENDDDLERECSDFADQRFYVERHIIFE
jgi:hypothetical protein